MATDSRGLWVNVLVLSVGVFSDGRVDFEKLPAITVMDFQVVFLKRRRPIETLARQRRYLVFLSADPNFDEYINPSQAHRLVNE